jgi:MATE family multidrug resistance protein
MQIDRVSVALGEGGGCKRLTMMFGVLGALLNIPLNYILMFGKLGFPALGTVGCGIASAIVMWVSLKCIRPLFRLI